MVVCVEMRLSLVVLGCATIITELYGLASYIRDFHVVARCFGIYIVCIIFS